VSRSSPVMPMTPIHGRADFVAQYWPETDPWRGLAAVGSLASRFFGARSRRLPAGDWLCANSSAFAPQRFLCRLIS